MRTGASGVIMYTVVIRVCKILLRNCSLQFAALDSGYFKKCLWGGYSKDNVHFEFTVRFLKLSTQIMM